MIHGIFLYREKVLIIHPLSSFTAPAKKTQSVLAAVISNIQICLDNGDALNLLLTPSAYKTKLPAEEHFFITYSWRKGDRLCVFV